MARFGIFCLPMKSHMNLFLTLAHALRNNGHHITFFAISSLRDQILGAGFDFCLIEPRSCPIGTLGKMINEMAARGNVGSMRLQMQFDYLRFQGILEQGPRAVKEARIDTMIVDQAEACSASVADVCTLPWVSVCNGLALNREPQIPPYFTPWSYRPTLVATLRNELAYTVSNLVARPLSKLINQYRKQWRLKPYERMDDSFSSLAQICQQPKEFDFPRRHLPPHFHYVGPIRSGEAAKIDFPWEQLNGKPLIYASLGTLVNHHPALFGMIAQACEGLDAQLVISEGGNEANALPHLPGAPLVFKVVPQFELLSKATLTITHSGLNTVLESLTHGVPLLALPITFEQPAIASRVVWTHTGEMLSPRRATASSIRSLIKTLLHDMSYRRSTQKMKAALSVLNGIRSATQIIEKVAESGQPALRETS
jgi:zeaxanthin glucosyltransferase